MSYLTYWFYPNPGNASYTSAKALTLLVICSIMVLVAFSLPYWRNRLDPVAKRLSRSWKTALLWFGITGLMLVVARVETISYVSMRCWWAVWFVSLAVYIYVQYKMFKAKHYTVVPTEKTEDPRNKYLPGK